MVPTLTPRELRALRARAHHLQVTVQVGKAGVTPGVVQAAREALDAHELVKVRRQRGCPVTREEVARALAEALDAAVVQEMGHVVVLYRPRPDES